MSTPDMSKQWEAVAFDSYEKEGEKKWIRHFIGNLIADKEDEGFTLFIPPHMALMGKIRIQPKQDKDRQTSANQQDGPEQVPY